MALAAVLLGGCTGARLVVHDQGTGVAVVHAQALILAGGQEEEVDSADAAGRLHVSLPADPEAVVAVRASGFLQWSKPVRWFSTQPQPVVIDLEPVWMGNFLKTGLKPAQIVESKGCACHQQKAR
jgi:hypothetical protein